MFYGPITSNGALNPHAPGEITEDRINAMVNGMVEEEPEEMPIFDGISNGSLYYANLGEVLNDL